MEDAALRERIEELEDALLLARLWMPKKAEWCAWPRNRENVARVLAVVATIDRAKDDAR